MCSAVLSVMQISMLATFEQLFVTSVISAKSVVISRPEHVWRCDATLDNVYYDGLHDYTHDAIASPHFSVIIV